ncbi:MAG: arginase family protein [Nanoarchaeota archaeon]|jgi:arginase family enzyme|nr:arginase family protein [Nanoarchaeota archaeon]
MKVVKIPQVNGLGKTKGVGEAPDKVLAAIDEIYSNDLGKAVSRDLLDVTDVPVGENLIDDNDLIYKKAFASYGAEKVLFLGGDHSMSYPTTRAFFDYCEHNGREPSLIIFDAHPDLMEPVDYKIPTHEEWLRSLIKDGFNPKDILLVGCRNADPSELKVLAELGIKRVSVESLMSNLEGRTDYIMEFGYGKDVYVSMDIDVIDPAFAPGTGYCEPAGLTSREFLYIVKRLNKMKNLKALDLVEVNPSKDINGMTVAFAAKILSELI